MLTEICAEIKNYFTYEEDKHFGDFAISDGSITPSLDLPTDYIRIVGSHKNDGVHKVSDHDLVDEGKFHGAIWIMSPPEAFLALANEITAWQAKYGGIDSEAMSPFYSESFGGYSYQKSAGSVSGSGAATDWQSVYGKRLNIYRRIRV
ncbi:MAG: hypothetical protein IK078_11605 [Lachnospiraceae bacterium]|nr:hypothetical protein [Lachnospiraceae bacterium]